MEIIWPLNNFEEIKMHVFNGQDVNLIELVNIRSFKHAVIKLKKNKQISIWIVRFATSV